MYHMGTSEQMWGGRKQDVEAGASSAGRLANASVLLSTCFFVFRLSKPSAFIFSLLTVSHFGVFKKLQK